MELVAKTALGIHPDDSPRWGWRAFDTALRGAPSPSVSCDTAGLDRELSAAVRASDSRGRKL
jgi:hypothetical protein